MRVLKFGGKSLDTLEKVQKICKNIRKIYEKDKKLVIVVSAMGNTTNLLLEKANLFSGATSPERELSILLSTGEIISAALFSMTLSSLNVPSVALTARDIELRTFGGFQNATVYYLNKSKIQTYLDSNTVVVICGFQGINQNDEITTLGRGGSDTTAVALAGAFNVSAEIYSDFDGVCAGDPQTHPYKKIKSIDYDSMLQMSEAGAKVLDSKAVEVAKNHNTKIFAKCSSSLNLSGSTISRISEEFVSISKTENLTKLSIVFNNYEKFDFISKIVLNELKKNKFYNLNIKNNNISFLIPTKNCEAIEASLAQKLNIIKKQG